MSTPKSTKHTSSNGRPQPNAAKGKNNSGKPKTKPDSGMVSGSRHIGTGVGEIIDYVTGRGSYHIERNTLMNRGAPIFRENSESVTITNREFVTNIGGSVSFSNLSFLVNPGNASLFPWLSNVAQNFETYEFQGLILYYNPTSGNATGADTRLGKVVIASNYDVLNPLFGSMQEAEAYKYCTSTVPSEPMAHGVECKPDLIVAPRQYITNALSIDDLTARDDPRFHYRCISQIMTEGQPQGHATGLGELWVSYQVKLITHKKPQLEGLDKYISITYRPSSSHFPYGTTTNISKTSTLAGAVFVDAVFGTLNFKVNGRYHIEWYLSLNPGNVGGTFVNGFAAGAGTFTNVKSRLAYDYSAVPSNNSALSSDTTFTYERVLTVVNTFDVQIDPTMGYASLVLPSLSVCGSDPYECVTLKVSLQRVLPPPYASGVRPGFILEDNQTEVLSNTPTVFSATSTKTESGTVRSSTCPSAGSVCIAKRHP